MAEPDTYESVTDSILEVTEPPKPKKRGKTKYDAEMNDKLCSAIDAEISDSYNYSNAELYSQMRNAWRWYYREPLGNEIDGFSRWVSPMILRNVNQIRAFITGQYFRNSAPIIKFRPKSADDVDAARIADEYINYLFRNKLNGHKIVDDLVFNAALLKMAPVRIFMKEISNYEDIEFKYKGDDAEELENRLAAFFVANPEFQEQDPDYSKEAQDDDGTLDYCYRWKTEKIVERYPTIDVVSPGSFFVSRQAEDEQDARMVAQMSRMTISELKEMYPEAPMLNGWKKKDYDQFWDELVGDYQEWYTEIEWLAKWAYDSLGYVSQYTEGNDRSAGLGPKQIFVMDAEIKVDLEDTGHSQLCHVIKVGNYILHKRDITERSFLWASLLPTANRWLGLSFYDILQQEAREETINKRAFTDATVQAAHANPVVDPDQMEMEDIENRGPDTVIRRKRGAGAKQGVPGIDWVKQPGPDGTVLQAVQAFQADATSMTGVGANFQGATQDEVSDMRMSTETAKIIDNNSSLMLNYFARNFSAHLCNILVKLLNVAVNGSATAQMLQIKDRWEQVDPMFMLPRSDYVLNADIGVNDAQEKALQAQTIMGMLQAASGGGGQDPNTGAPIPQIPIQLTPLAGYQAATKLLEANGVMDVDTYLINPEIPAEDAQVAGIMQQVQQALQQIPAMVEQGVQQSIEAAKQDATAQKDLAQAEKLKAETEKTLTEVEKGAFEVANQIEAEERRTEEAAWKEGVAQEDNSSDREKWEAEMDFKYEELKQAERLAEKAAKTQANAVLSP